VINFFYGLSSLGSSMISFVVSSWLLYYYLPPEGNPLVPVAFYGGAVLISRIASAFATPYIGYRSDNAQNRWGRRLPFMFFSALPLIILFVLLWFPPNGDTSFWNLVYLCFILVFFRIASVFYQIPYQALLPELAQTDHYRVRISAFQSGFFLLGIMFGGLAGLLIDHYNYKFAAFVYAGVALLLLYVPLLVLREKQNQRIENIEQLDFRHSFWLTLRNRPFLIFGIVWAFYLTTSAFIQSSAPYIITEICLLSEGDTIFFYIPSILASLACYPLITWLSDRFGKHQVYSGSLLASAIVFPLIMLIGNWIPLALRTQCVAWATLQAVALSGAVVLSAAFIAEITDWDAAQTGQRREGMFFATIKIWEQLVDGIAMALLPLIFLLGRSHSAPNGPLGVRLAGVVSGLLMIAAFIVFLHYPVRGYSEE
jgi:GPH family glycoside/pentoside/hexuronide:cation symporter